MSYQRRHGRRPRGRAQPQMRHPQTIRPIYWLFGVGAFFIGASAFQLVHFGRLGHPWAFVGAVILVCAYVGGAMTMAVRISHDDDEWRWF
jgi:hypothetical protein